MVPSVSATGLADELSLIFLIALKVYDKKYQLFASYEILSKFKDNKQNVSHKKQTDAGNRTFNIHLIISLWTSR